MRTNRGGKAPFQRATNDSHFTTPIPLERLLITRQRVFVFFSAPVLLRVVFPRFFDNNDDDDIVVFELTFVTLLSTIVNRSLFHSFYFYFCPLVDIIVMARYNFVSFDVLYCLQMLEFKKKKKNYRQIGFTLAVCSKIICICIILTNLIILIFKKCSAYFFFFFY